MRDFACTFSQMKCINMFSLYLQSGVPRHFPWRLICGLNIEPHCFHVHVPVRQCWPRTLVMICRNMGIWDVLMLCLALSPRGNTSWVYFFSILLRTRWIQSALVQVMAWCLAVRQQDVSEPMVTKFCDALWQHYSLHALGHNVLCHQ